MRSGGDSEDGWKSLFGTTMDDDDTNSESGSRSTASRRVDAGDRVRIEPALRTVARMRPDAPLICDSASTYVFACDLVPFRSDPIVRNSLFLVAHIVVLLLHSCL